MVGEIRAPRLDEDCQWRDRLVPEVFGTDDDSDPDAELLWAQQRAGRAVLREETG